MVRYKIQNFQSSSMAKRKLTQRQQTRAADLQQKRVARAQSHDIETVEANLGSAQDGRIISHFGVKVLVESTSGAHFTCNVRQNLGSLVVGDEVIWQAQTNIANEGIVIAAKPRRNLLERPLFHGEIKPVAANIDQILIIASPVPALQPELLDRYLVNTEIAGIQPIIVFNKMDLLDAETRQQIDTWQSIYQSIGYQTLRISTALRAGVDELRTVLQHKVSILVGQSGVGKSSTIKMLVPNIDVQTAELVKTHALGKHKTSVSRLYHLPEGGDIIDSPGVRDFGLWNLAVEKVVWGFREFRPFLGQCKFKDCQHRSEPGCAIKVAVEAKQIHPLRLQNYHTLVDTIKQQTR